ncbi:cathepsin d [Plakobranchus ocellatus]|uniref:Cathepsin d n=1 Tax=Plakobranchus ocellatus TaxID=259542 RepID=A0AAV4BMC1_9GAST|nr:cathepsin d [Plakobranchus ocellatus]
MHLFPAAVLTITLISSCAARVLNFPVNAASRSRTHFHRGQPQQRLHAPVRLRALSRQDGNRKHVRAKASTIDIELQNLNNTVYYGSINVGTPGQQLNVAFDTGSSATWIFSERCLSSPDCHMHRKYNNASSTTLKNKLVRFAFEYFTGSLSGVWVEDSISVGGLTVENQTFGLATVNDGVYENVDIDGMIGLGFLKMFGGKEPNLFDNMVGQGLLQNPVFSFYFNRKDSDDPSSRLTLGGTNPDLYTGDFTFVDLTAQNRWQFEGDWVQLNDGEVIFSKYGFQAVVESDNDMIVGPYEDVSDLNMKLGATLLSENGYLYVYEINCDSIDSLPDVEFIVDGKKLALSSKDYIVKRNGRCLSAFAGKKNSTVKRHQLWILGTPFMRGFYTQFDKGNGRIGFAKAKHLNK